MTRLTWVGVTVLTMGLATAAAAQGEAPGGVAPGAGGRCSERMLKGTYGVTISGWRPGARGELEPFVGLSMQTYDGEGNFTQIDNTHGLTTVNTDQPGYGTYTVNADCSGTKTLSVEGLPFRIENRLIVLDKGDEFLLVVMAPSPIVVTATGKRLP